MTNNRGEGGQSRHFLQAVQTPLTALQATANTQLIVPLDLYTAHKPAGNDLNRTDQVAAGTVPNKSPDRESARDPFPPPESRLQTPLFPPAHAQLVRHVLGCLPLPAFLPPWPAGLASPSPQRHQPVVVVVAAAAAAAPAGRRRTCRAHHREPGNLEGEWARNEKPRQIERLALDKSESDCRRSRRRRRGRDHRLVPPSGSWGLTAIMRPRRGRSS